MKIVAAESLVLVGLFLLSSFALWTALSVEGLPKSSWIESLAGRLPEYASSELMLAILLCVGIYWALQLFGHAQTAFWLIALLILLLHAPAIWGHNQLHLYRLVGLDASLDAVNSQLLDTTLFLVSLVGLVALYRIIGLRKLGRQLASQRIEKSDRNRIMLCEALILLALIVGGLLLSFVIVLVAIVLGRSDALLVWSPWTVLSVGGGASLVFALTLVLWFRTRENVTASTDNPAQDSIPSPRARRTGRS